VPSLLRTSAAKPNIIFIITDDQRYDTMGFMDKPWLQTPNMARLAREGVHFVNSFVTTSLCSPSRASFLTGRYPHCHGVINNFTPWRDDNVTFLELLHAHGYDTALIGKWHMTGKSVPDLVGQGKVNRMVSFYGQGKYFDCPLIVNGKNTESKGYITDTLTRYAIEFLGQSRKKPFCLYLSHKAVHGPFKPPERYSGMLKQVSFPDLGFINPNLPQIPGINRQRKKFKKNIQSYHEALIAVDDSLGKVLDFLDARGMAENTLVIYTSDNGYMWGEHGLLGKRYAYEESIRVPHLFRYPRLVPKGGRKVSEMVLNIDLAPTLLSAADIAPPDIVQGRSYLELATGKSVPWRESFLYEYFKDPLFPHPPIQAVRTREWKYIHYLNSQFPDELYHLSVDPKERHDLAKDPAHTSIKKKLKVELERLKRKYAC